ncbi:hypothetical protein BU24DRAFT_197528 [Aaosphaeria arxii CBS 175.79]|uniref:Uncharacterized protein n=1 Tax=Aaosphaeria arxii CBS 175.79 TaxID=1450172 RepID=A0A6A5XTL6_9PLEO|nr:uncharacterized protein BU24DRAFT_197528 [Aaosphaeria arxii CBS 175.79]KAF2016259.1 hypothetical protein BU24DRAFT_197528 [Aaosphaeria arxii CBS 175.79]
MCSVQQCTYVQQHSHAVHPMKKEKYGVEGAEEECATAFTCQMCRSISSSAGATRRTLGLNSPFTRDDTQYVLYMHSPRIIPYMAQESLASDYIESASLIRRKSGVNSPTPISITITITTIIISITSHQSHSFVAASPLGIPRLKHNDPLTSESRLSGSYTYKSVIPPPSVQARPRICNPHTSR